MGRKTKTSISLWAVIEGMQREEAEHRRSAERLGARELPELAKLGMRVAARLMTTLSYRI